MQAKKKKGYLSGSVTRRKGATGDVWVFRYRLPSGKHSDARLGKVWDKKSRAPEGYLTLGQANAAGQAFLDQHADSVPDDRKTFRRAAEDFLLHSEREKACAKTTLHEYRRLAKRLGQRYWREGVTWDERPIDTFDDSDVLEIREELLDLERAANTMNHYRRVIRGIFGTKSNSPALIWDWMGVKPNSDGKLHFYDPAQMRKLCAQATSELDVTIWTLATQAGPRMSEIRGLKVGNVDFEIGKVRFEDGYTTRGGHGGTKGRRVRSVDMSDDVRKVLWPYCAGRDKDELVFEHDDKPGEPLCGTGMYRRFLGAAQRAGLPQIRFHDLRHSFGTQAIRRFNIYEVQRMMGHASITTTERYLHYAPDPEAATKLSGLWAVPEDADVVRLRSVS